jgi:hypothetical protein
MDSNHGHPQRIPPATPTDNEPILSEEEIHFDVLSMKVMELVGGKYVIC